MLTPGGHTVLGLVLLIVALAGCGAAPAGEKPRPTSQIINVYSARDDAALKTVLARFSNETAIQVQLTPGSTQTLLERLRAEGTQTAADIFLAVDAGSLELAAAEGLLQPIDSDLLRSNIPAELRDPDGRWFGLAQQVRTIVYNPARVPPEAVPTYESLADPGWRGRLCMLSGSHILTISLAASLLAAHEPAQAAAIVKGWAANQPQYFDSDEPMLDALATGSCDVAIVSQAALGARLATNPFFPLKLTWANQADRGAHRNILGVGITASARNREGAVRLVEWLSAAGQAPDRYGLPGGSYEFPVNPLAATNPFIADFGAYRADPLPLAEYGRLQADALRLLTAAGYR